jgi:hypothetical protein
LDSGQACTQRQYRRWWEGDLPYEFAWLRTFAINPRNSDIVYAGSGSCHQGSILRSEDGGLSFTPVYTPTFITGNCEDGQENIFALAVAPSMSSTVYAGGNYCYQGQCNYAVMVRSTNDGASWTEVLTLPLNSTIEALAVNPRSATTVYAGGQECGEDSCPGFVYRTRRRDPGVRCNSHPDDPSIVIDHKDRPPSMRPTTAIGCTRAKTPVIRGLPYASRRGRVAMSAVICWHWIPS